MNETGDTITKEERLAQFKPTVPEQVRAWYARIGRLGGAKSRRKLTTEQAVAMARRSAEKRSKKGKTE